MPKTKKKRKREAHRPRIPIDWDMVDKMLQAGCNGVQIASYFGCDSDTIYHRCEQERGLCFTEYMAKKRAHGDALLHLKQFAFAMTGVNGNLGMLIWLGKNRLNQKEDPQQQVAFNGSLADTLDLLKTLSNSTNLNNHEQKST